MVELINFPNLYCLYKLGKFTVAESAFLYSLTCTGGKKLQSAIYDGKNCNLIIFTKNRICNNSVTFIWFNVTI